MAHAVALSSGTAALQLALRLLDVGPGDSVATATFTVAATAYAVMYLGAKPIFIDSEPGTWNMCPQLLAEEIDAARRRNRPIKAVLPVDIFGQCADYGRIVDIVPGQGVPLVEDAAEALGAEFDGRLAGGFGEIGCFSFNGNKIITTSGGGMLVTNHGPFADKARHWSTQARDPAPHYEHSELGYNYRLSNLLAAIGRGQLTVLDQRVAARRANFEFYQRAIGDLPGIAFMPEHPRGRSTRWLTCITIDAARFGATREDVRLALEAENIESRPLWKPMHMQPLFAHCRAAGGAFSELLFRDGLCLPSGSSLTDADRERVVRVIRRSRAVRETLLSCPRNSILFVVTLHGLEQGVLLPERRDPAQGAVLRSWLESDVHPAFAGRILPVDEAVARQAAQLHVPDPRPIRDAPIAATSRVHGMTGERVPPAGAVEGRAR